MNRNCCSYRKIMPYALSAERKNKILEEAGSLKIYQSLFFVSKYLDDPATSVEAARSVISIALSLQAELSQECQATW